MRYINPNIFPKDGYKFQDRDGSWHHADSWAGVIKRVRIYRTRNKMEMGNPEVEVIEQACARAPNLCVDNNGHTEERVKVASLKSRVLQRMNALSQAKEKNQVNFVEHDESRQRAEICAKCPKNISIPAGCASCKAALKHLREVVIGKRFVDGRLSACAVFGSDLATEVHLDEVRINHADLPGNCWRKTTI
jgi:hypothetical protein